MTMLMEKPMTSFDEISSRMQIVGVTGTRRGITLEQTFGLEKLLDDNFIIALHHGQCVGADEEAHKAALRRKMYIEVHPPLIKKYVFHIPSTLEYLEYNRITIMPELPYLERNKKIVSASDFLIALPKEETGMKQRSGTWSTVRYAQQLKRTVHVVRPSGLIEIM